jgi:hypothetical protein
MAPFTKSTLTITRRAARRWRWIALAAVLCAGAYLGWWTQNFGDPRYVGRWRVVQDNEGRMTTQIEFMADGSGRMFQLIELHGELIEDPIQDFLWGVQRERLLIDNNPLAGKLSVLQRIELTLHQWLFGLTVRPQTLDYRVTEVERDHLLFVGASEAAAQEQFEIVKVVE